MGWSWPRMLDELCNNSVERGDIDGGLEGDID
jgi:hypothetical protein